VLSTKSHACRNQHATFDHGSAATSENLAPTALVMHQLWSGARPGVALTALVAAFTPRPPCALVLAVSLALMATVAAFFGDHRRRRVGGADAAPT
jgi:hypothetical protein